jgi:2-desacetyl-2-hydroxyethyl bacteriochlorophyllide A dehydrogenase
VTTHDASMNLAGPNPETSIVIRAFNEERWLPEVFAALGRQIYRDFEVVLVDSGSLDRTRQIASTNGARIIRIRSEDFTFGHSLNVGIRAARGRFIAIISAHAIPADEHWLERMIEPLRDELTAMTYGGQRGHQVSKFSECIDFERMFPDRPAVYAVEDGTFTNNANSAVRRDLWEAHEFDEGLPGLEDLEWARHMVVHGYRVVYVPSATIIHVHTESWPQVRRRYHREAMAARWIRMRILRHVPSEILRESRWFIADCVRAAQAGRLLALAGEIARFRFEKTVGTVAGIVDSRGLDSPGHRAAHYYEQNYSAVVVRAPHRAAIEYRAVPVLKPGEVLIRVAYVGICGTDLEILEGSLGYYKSGMGEYPIVPGHECSGTIVGLGPRIAHLAEGDRVVVECIQGCGDCEACRADDAISCKERREMGVLKQDGGYAEYLVARARYVHQVPSTLPLAHAAVAEPLAVVLKALRRAGVALAEGSARRVLVVGAGAIGHLASKVLAARGHHVTMVDHSAARLALAGDGITTATSMQELAQYDVIFEATGNQMALSRILKESRTGSTLLLLGFPYASESFSFEEVVAFDRTIVGSVGSAGRDFESALQLLPAISLDGFFGPTFPLAQYSRAWERVRTKQDLKVMLQLDAAAAG